MGWPTTSFAMTLKGFSLSCTGCLICPRWALPIQQTEPPEPGLSTTAHTASVFGVSSLWSRNCFMKYSSASYRFLFLAAIFGLLALNCLWISSVRSLSDIFPSQKPSWSIWAQITVGFFLCNSYPSPRKPPIKCGYMEIKKQEYTGVFFCQTPTWDLRPVHVLRGWLGQTGMILFLVPTVFVTIMAKSGPWACYSLIAVLFPPNHLLECAQFSSSLELQGSYR